VAKKERIRKLKTRDILNAILNSTPESIITVDREGKIILANKTLAQRVGKPLEEIIGSNMRDVFGEDVAKKRKEAIDKVFETKEPLIFEDEREGRCYEAHMNPVFDESGEVSSVLVCAFDVTKRKEAEKRAKFERDQLFSLFDSIEEIIYVADPVSYEVLYANRFLKEMFGKDPTGGICYKEFQGFDHPCDFCTNPIIMELKGKSYRWEYYNPLLKRYYDITDRIIKWIDGRDVRFELAIDITERKNAETALRLSEEMYRSALSNLIEGFARTTVDGKIIIANPSFARIYGYTSPEEMIRSVKDTGRDLFVNREDAERLFENVKKEGFVENFESQRKRKDGQLIWVSSNVRAIKDEEGKILFLEGTEIDITDKKNALMELEGERRKFFILLENLPFAVVLCDDKGKYLYANPKFKEITGYTLEEVPDGNTFVKKVYPDPRLRHEVISLWKKDVESFKIGESIDRTFPIVCKDGAEKKVTIKTAYLAEGLYVMTFEDVTERERNETLLRESEERYRSLFENAYEGIFQSTLEGTYTMANPAMLRILGYSSFEELKESVKDIRNELYVNPEDRDRFLEILHKEGKVMNFETQFRRKDGNIIYVNTTAWPIRDESGKILYIQGITEDVTERKKKEEELNSLREQFLQAQKMEAIGRLAGGVAHDFNNILTVILGTCQIALMNLKNEEKLKKNIESIMHSAEKAASLTRQLLAYSRKQLMQIRVIDLNELIEGMEEMLKRLLGEDIEIEMYLEKNLGKIKADPTHLQQVIMNLATNAKDAMPEGGKLIIETFNVQLTEDYARTHFGVEPGPYVMISFTDTGTGIPKDIIPHIFEPFFTTKEKGEGTGLGLSTVYGIVKQLGGHIYVYSEEGRGTTFKIYFPRTDEKIEEEKKEEKIEEKIVVPSEKTVLIIEDDESVLKVTSEMVRSMGFKVIEAQNEEQAVEVAKNTGERIDIIITDVVIPGIKAPVLIAKLKKFHPNAKVLFMSGYTENAIAQYGILYPGINFIQKPFSKEELERKILEILKTR